MKNTAILSKSNQKSLNIKRTSVSDPYHFDAVPDRGSASGMMDPDPGPEQIPIFSFLIFSV